MLAYVNNYKQTAKAHIGQAQKQHARNVLHAFLVGFQLKIDEAENQRYNLELKLFGVEV